MPRALWSVHKIHHILIGWVSSGKDKVSCPEDKLGRDNRNKKDSSMAGCPRASLEFQVPQTEPQRLSGVGIRTFRAQKRERIQA